MRKRKESLRKEDLLGERFKKKYRKKTPKRRPTKRGGEQHGLQVDSLPQPKERPTR